MFVGKLCGIPTSLHKVPLVAAFGARTHQHHYHQLRFLVGRGPQQQVEFQSFHRDEPANPDGLIEKVMNTYLISYLIKYYMFHYPCKKVLKQLTN